MSKYKIVIGLVILVVGLTIGKLLYDIKDLEKTIAEKNTEIVTLNANIIDLTTKVNIFEADKQVKQTSISALEDAINLNNKNCDEKTTRLNELYKICINSKTKTVTVKSNGEAKKPGQNKEFLNLRNSIINDIRR